MATADVIRPTDISRRGAIAASVAPEQKPVQHNVRSVLNYYKDPEDGTPPAPFYTKYVDAGPLDFRRPDRLTPPRSSQPPSRRPVAVSAHRERGCGSHRHCWQRVQVHSG